MTAFSNGFEYESWRVNWCDRCTAEDGKYCPILELPLMHNTVPPQWTPGTDDLRDRYHCSDFTPASPH